MKVGKYEEGRAVLRLKIDMMSPNPTLWDPVAYRIKYTPHPVTGTQWCMYPSYDYSHAIIDSLEHIDYSLCTLEFEVRGRFSVWLVVVMVQARVWACVGGLGFFYPTVFASFFQVRRDLYYWTIDKLNMWRPHVWEFSRLNLTRALLSKRKILKHVTE